MDLFPTEEIRCTVLCEIMAGPGGCQANACGCRAGDRYYSTSERGGSPRRVLKSPGCGASDNYSNPLCDFQYSYSWGHCSLRQSINWRMRSRKEAMVCSEDGSVVLFFQALTRSSPNFRARVLISSVNCPSEGFPWWPTLRPPAGCL